MTVLLDNWRIALVLIGIIAVSVFMGIRSCNKYTQDKQNEITPIKDIIIDSKSSDDNCVRVTGKPCPRVGK